jgi:hypothetical protein
VTDRWALADLRATAIMDAARTGAVAERNGRRLAEAAGLATRREPEPSPRGQVDMSAPADGWLHRLMACPSWSGRRLDPEEELSLWVAAELRRLTRSGALRAVWTRCPVEVRRGGKLAAMWQCLGRVLGVVPGCPDFLVLWGGGAGGIELKVERAQGDNLRQGQKDFREWCVSNGVRHEVCRSVPEVTGALRRWGRLP